MKEVIIGKEGTQKFAINASRVSRQHAKITILDNGQWILEDLNSTNGTYIIDENDELVQIKRMNITEFTRIVLADQTSMGFTFYAHHVLEDDPANYQQEFRHVLQIHDKALMEKAGIDVRLYFGNDRTCTHAFAAFTPEGIWCGSDGSVHHNPPGTHQCLYR